MSQQLHEAFERLADRAPGVDASPRAAIRTWETAARQRRRSIAVTSLVTVLVLVCAGAIGWAASALQQPVPAPASGTVAPAIPNALYQPSPWVQSTADSGPIGPLALLDEAPHQTSWTHVDNYALFGVSALTGAYRFIDLPGRFDPESDVSQSYILSPDGTQIGYWLGGHPSDEPDVTRVVGFAAYDTVTGKVTTHLVPTDRGLMGEWLAWSGDSTRLVAAFGQIRDAAGNESGPDRSVAWRPGESGVLPLEGLGTGLFTIPSTGAAGLYAFHDAGRTLTVVDPSDGRQASIRVSIPGYFGAVISPNGTLLAYNERTRDGVGSNPGGTQQSRYADLARLPEPAASGSTWAATRLDVRSSRVGIVGWIDDAHLLLTTWTSPAPYVSPAMRVVSYDVRTGSSAVVLSVRSPSIGIPSIATGLIARPFVERAIPPTPIDPRKLWVVIAACVLALAMIPLVLFRVRARRAQRLRRAAALTGRRVP